MSLSPALDTTRPFHDHFVSYVFRRPIQVAARSKAYFYDGSIAGIAGSNPTEGTNIRVAFVVSNADSCLFDWPITRPGESTECVSLRDQMQQ